MWTAGKIKKIDITSTRCSLTGESDDYSQDYQAYNQISLEAVSEGIFKKIDRPLVY